MNITEVRVKAVDYPEDRLRGFATITLDDELVIRDLKVLLRDPDHLFIAMPSRKLSVKCSKCYTKNHLRAKFCNQCGIKIPPVAPAVDSTGRHTLYADIAHPINSDFREYVQDQVLIEYDAVLKEPNRYDYDNHSGEKDKLIL